MSVHDAAPGRVVVFSALDNLVKGAAGQAVQNLNLALGCPKTTDFEARGGHERRRRACTSSAGPLSRIPGCSPAAAEELRRARGRVLVVHGGGRDVERHAEGARPWNRSFVGGRRETSPEAMEVVEMVLSGVVNKGAGRRAHRRRPAGPSGSRDATPASCAPHPARARPRREPESVDDARPGDGLGRGLRARRLPVSQGADGGALNVNADEAALALAVALHAEALLYLSDVDGVRLGAETVASLSADEVRHHVGARRDHGRYGDEGRHRAAGRGRGRAGGDRGPEGRGWWAASQARGCAWARSGRGAGMTSLLPVYERDLVMVSGKGARLYRLRGQHLPGFRGRHRRERPRLRRPQVATPSRSRPGRAHPRQQPLLHGARDRAWPSDWSSWPSPSRVFFTNSGTEAVEAAIKFARRIGHEAGPHGAGRLRGRFHGRTMGALSLTWTEIPAPFEPLVPGVRFCPWNDLGAAKAMIGPKTAAVFIEPVQGEGGMRVAPGDFLHGLADICREAGAVLVCDEVQCGLGRTGAMFAFQQARIRPDIVTLAKPLGRRLPLGAVLLREELAGALQVGDHGSTFGGNAVAAAASLVVMEKLTSNGFLGKVEKKGKTLGRNLRAIQRKYPNQIRDVRGVGLMFGIELQPPRDSDRRGAAGAGDPRHQSGRECPPPAAAPGGEGQRAAVVPRRLRRRARAGRGHAGGGWRRRCGGIRRARWL